MQIKHRPAEGLGGQDLYWRAKEQGVHPASQIRMEVCLKMLSCDSQSSELHTCVQHPVPHGHSTSRSWIMTLWSETWICSDHALPAFKTTNFKPTQCVFALLSHLCCFWHFLLLSSLQVYFSPSRTSTLHLCYFYTWEHLLMGNCWNSVWELCMWVKAQFYFMSRKVIRWKTH